MALGDYSKTTWTDEVLAGAERFEILDNAGAAVDDVADLAECQITLKTAITTPGTSVNATALQNIEDKLEEVDTAASSHDDDIAILKLLATELKLTDSIPPISDVTPAPLAFIESTGAAPNPTFAVLYLDAAADEGRQWNFILDRRYGGSPVLKVHYYMASANTSKNAVLVARLAAIGDGDGSVTAKVFAAANSETVAVPDTAGAEDVASITLTNADSMAAGDRIVLLLYRDADDGSDDAAGDMVITGVELQYTI